MILSNALKNLIAAVPFGMIVLFGDTPGKLEGRIFPVVGNVHVVEETVGEGGTINLSIEVEKLRDCRRTDQNQVYIKGKDGYWSFAPVVRDNPTDEKLFSSPTGQYMVTWNLLAPPWLIGQPIRIVTHHQCWGVIPWDVETVSNFKATSGLAPLP